MEGSHLASGIALTDSQPAAHLSGLQLVYCAVQRCLDLRVTCEHHRCNLSVQEPDHASGSHQCMSRYSVFTSC